MKKSPFAGYKEGKESPKQERAEPKGLQRFEARRGMEKRPSVPMFKRSGRGK